MRQRHGGVWFRLGEAGQACVANHFDEAVTNPEKTAACIAAPCLPAVYLGTLYWFFYGTAFVIGILEIIAGVSSW